MSGEMKRIKRTLSKDVTDTSHLVSYFNQAWDRLPLEMAVHIYSFLPMNDKRNMSLTCKFWLAAFRHPGIWRSSHFVFSGNTSLKRNIPDEVLSSLQYVTIDCSVRRDTKAQEMKTTERVVNFVVGLNESKNTTLQKLNILQMEDFDDITISGLHYHLSTLLAKQTKLCELSLFKADVDPEIGIQLLTAASQTCAHCIKYLNLHNVSTDILSHEPVFLFPEICESFKNLTEFTINCGNVSDDLLTHLPGTLKLIIIWVYWWDVFSYKTELEYSDNGWNVLVSKCTGLKAKYFVEDFEMLIDNSLSLVFVPAVPLATLHWCSRQRNPNIIRSCFDHIINTFKNRLEHVHVDVGCTFVSERDVVDVVESCPLLQSFSINGTSAPLNIVV